MNDHARKRMTADEAAAEGEAAHPSCCLSLRSSSWHVAAWPNRSGSSDAWPGTRHRQGLDWPREADGFVRSSGWPFAMSETRDDEFLGVIVVP